MKKNHVICNIVRIGSCISLSMVLLNANAGENRAHESSRLKLVDEIDSILVDAGLCETKDLCSSKQLFFVSPARNGLGVITYSIKNPDILSKITQKCMEVFYSKNIGIIIENYEISKQEELKKWISTEVPFNEIEFKKRDK